MLGTLRGSIVNNLWWVIMVTILSTAFGLAVAVLADRAKGENVAKSLIFLPLAISFVGAGVIWTLIYQTSNVNKPQTGVLNAIWIGLGELSNSGWQKWLVVAVALAIVGGLVYVAWSGRARRELQPGGGRRRHRRAAGRLDRRSSCSAASAATSRPTTAGWRRRSPTWSPTSRTTTCG